MDIVDYASYEQVSPFELKDRLTALATSRADRMMLDAGRGNPNFLATMPRNAFFQLGLFAMQEAEAIFTYMPENVGGHLREEGLEARFEAFVIAHAALPGIAFLSGAVSYVRDALGLSAESFLFEMTNGILACEYPTPPRMLATAEAVAGAYLVKEMLGGVTPAGGMDLFAVEGGTAAMSYIFSTLRENKLISPGDRIAIGMPVFTPYIEIPQLDDFQLVEVAVTASASEGWQYSDSELAKLSDPAVKAFFVVNPSNPPSVKMNQRGLARIAEIVRTSRPDLIIITDDVYGTFADDFTSLFSVCPRNTILVYSFSKHFGATGWRLGVIATHKDTILDHAIAALPEVDLAKLQRRYSTIAVDSRSLKFIDRLVADSRTVALNHTAGLSTPQQVQLALFALSSLMDESDAYKNAVKRIVRRRQFALFSELAIGTKTDPNGTDYYALLDLEAIATELHGPVFAAWMLAKKQPLEMLFRLADEGGVVLLPGKGFGCLHPSARISLANLMERDYTRIGAIIKTLAEEYFAEFQSLVAGAPAVSAVQVPLSTNLV